jgi:hypothetical protein
MAVEQILLWEIGCSETPSVPSDILEGYCYVEEMLSHFMAHKMTDAIFFELKFWNALGNDHEVLVRRHRNNLEGNKKGV